MKLTMSSEMGIHATWFLAGFEGRRPVPSKVVAQAISVSETYVAKVLKRLEASGILGSRKGRMGGWFLRREPADVTLADLVTACEGEGALYSCLHETRGCTDHRSACPIGSALRRAEDAMFAELRRTTLADLLAFAPAGPRAPSSP